MDARKPKEILSGHDLIGFARRSVDGDQVAQRASSAKVTTEPQFRAQKDDDAAVQAADES